jgi:hypothetical protein
MAPKLTPEEIVTLQVLKDKGQSHTQIAQRLGITEGAVRYHLWHSRQRLLDPAHDGPGDRVAPVPQGELGRRQQEIIAQPVGQLPLDLYAALAEVAR